VRRRRFLRRVHPAGRTDLEHLGSEAGWTIPLTVLSPQSVCYLAGIGRDISFDLELVRRVGCRVHSFDPVPAAVTYAREQSAADVGIEIHPVGLWSSDTTLTFHKPERGGHVSYSAVNLHRTEAGFAAPVRSVASLMRELRDDHIDLLKLSAEGSEFTILDHVLSQRLPVGILCLELSQPVSLRRIQAAVDRLQCASFQLVDVRIDRTGWGWRTTFVSERAAG
jgi:FkbM family methyltransferase